ncbi:hypothetical protein [Acidocella sp.]|uniref:hypothetical protein n=1 Tax=Acidocella sp. TaxID=50710 RepID=UPI002616E6F4|nr:hypothetical protein [Acidocella sp.]
MRIQTTPNFSPDGLGGNGAAVRDAGFGSRAPQPSSTRHRVEPAYDRQPAENDHDDGLVHGHFWAMSSTVR